MVNNFDQLAVIGLREWINLPELGMVGLRGKIDTGASTSTLHASDIVPFERDGEHWVRFTAHFGTHDPYASQDDVFVFHATRGMAYTVQSGSYFDPVDLRVFDAEAFVDALLPEALGGG